MTSIPSGRTAPSPLAATARYGLPRWRKSRIEYLLRNLVPAVTVAVPAERRDVGHYEANQVENWLTSLAVHLHAASVSRRAASSDLRLYTLWRIVGWRKPRYLAALTSAALSAAPLLLLGLIRSSLAICTLAVAPAIISARPQFAPNATWLYRAAPSTLRAHTGRLRFLRVFFSHLAPWLGFGLLVGSAIGAAYGWAYGLVMGLVAGATIGVVVGLGFGLAADVTTLTRPSSEMRQNIVYCAVVGITGGLAAANFVRLASEHTMTHPGRGVVLGAAAGIAFCVVAPPMVRRQYSYRGFAFLVRTATMCGPLGGMVGGLAGGMADGSVGALATGLAAGAGLAFNYGGFHWLRYVIAVRIGSRPGTLPSRPGEFLDWAYKAGLLRLSGATLQFRHRELQDWLALRSVAQANSAVVPRAPAI
jgi:hypothetical protein